MGNYIVVVDHPKDWMEGLPETELVSINDYLTDPRYLEAKGLHVVNLCRSYRYLGTGYYCSLLAEARHHRVIPSVRTLQDLSSKAIYSLGVEDLDSLVNKSLKKRGAGLTFTAFEVLVIFGQTQEPQLEELGRQLFELYRAPLLKVEFRRADKWRIGSLKAAHLNALPSDQVELFAAAFEAHTHRRWVRPRTKNVYRYDMAILWDPNEKLPPSNKRALQGFQKAGRALGLDVELIERKDYASLAEYDALFIRETTAVNHHTYRFAKKAESEGMVVIDDPDSILRCTNKVYLHELFQQHKVPAPKTLVLRKGEPVDIAAQLEFPLVLKIPHGSFSRGVYKARNQRECREYAERLFRESDLILAQEFLYTEFDWRVGLFNGEPLFVCQYFMSKQHWQIVRHGANGKSSAGDSRSYLVDDAPKEVVRIALKAARNIGKGLYGVDIKQNEDGLFVMEVNDNPNIDAGVEDACLKDELYRMVCAEFLRRLEGRGRRAGDSTT
ncbi:MAG: ATP-grasp domain-containing protein [Proteobacteria bacterium]|nr:MAG: ATP-grasp domain-containing protein [Pseudomonadota bacterium]QKK11124.1 MAG: RimK family protein [Pseudomonadota bacterium]